METKRDALQEDARIIARHAMDAIGKGAVAGRVYAFEDLGKYHAQAVREALNHEPLTQGRIAVRSMARWGNPNYRELVIKK